MCVTLEAADYIVWVIVIGMIITIIWDVIKTKRNK